MTAATPGQALTLAELLDGWRETAAELADEPMSSDQAAEYETLRTVIRQVEDAVAAQQPQPAPEVAAAMAEAGRWRDELENALRVMLLSRDTADAALAIRERTGLLPLKPAKAAKAQ